VLRRRAVHLLDDRRAVHLVEQLAQRRPPRRACAERIAHRVGAVHWHRRCARWLSLAHLPRNTARNAAAAGMLMSGVWRGISTEACTRPARKRNVPARASTCAGVDGSSSAAAA